MLVLRCALLIVIDGSYNALIYAPSELSANNIYPIIPNYTNTINRYIMAWDVSMVNDCEIDSSPFLCSPSFYQWMTLLTCLIPFILDISLYSGQI